MYTPHNLADGDVLTAAHLNHVDDGIAANELAAASLAAAMTAIETALEPPAHRITTTFSNVSGSNPATNVKDGNAYQTTLTPDTGYEIATVTVTMGGTDITATAYSNGTVSIPSVTGNVTITALASQIMYHIQNVLTNASNNNPDIEAAHGSAYQTTITPDTDYELTTVAVEMGGVDITSTAYSNGTVNISSVTGDVTITATSTPISSAIGSGKLGTMRLGTRSANT